MPGAIGCLLEWLHPNLMQLMFSPWEFRYPVKGWMTRQIFFGLPESVRLKTYLSRMKVHTEQAM